jgi:pilus assembly protein CpaF
MVDARLADGSRVNAIIPPLAIDGACVSIRKFSKDPLQVSDLVEKRSLTPEIAELLRGIVKARLNVLISGGTGCGKTTILNILSGFIPPTERIVTIEDAAELQLRQDHGPVGNATGEPRRQRRDRTERPGQECASNAA